MHPKKLEQRSQFMIAQFSLNNTDVKNDFSNKKFYFMANFYKKQRKRYNILLDSNDQPTGGKWSFDDQNRKKLPKNISLPDEFKIDFDNDLFTKSVNRWNPISQII